MAESAARLGCAEVKTGRRFVCLEEECTRGYLQEIQGAGYWAAIVAVMP
jgi:hypothetical protein